MEILRVPGEDSKCHFSYVISVGVCSCGYCVFFPNFVFFQAQRERERERICHWRIPICFAVMV
jgi:hypothetical protein